MKSMLFVVIIFINLHAIAQSPQLTLHVTMDSTKTEFIRYKIEMKICEPKKMTERGSWFTHDTSAIDFTSLKAADIDCGEYSYNGEGIEVLSGDKKFAEFNAYEFSGQVFAWEKIFVFKISNRSSRAWWPEMYLVLPVKYKSFVTYIDLTDIEFQSGKVVFLTDIDASYVNSRLTINHSLKNDKTVEVKDFLLKEVLEKN